MIKKIIYILSTTFFLISKPAYSWRGYDYEDQATIEISEGNLVREGLIIEFYDVKNDNFNNGKILLMEETSSGSTTLKIHDLTIDKERIFIMME